MNRPRLALVLCCASFWLAIGCLCAGAYREGVWFLLAYIAFFQCAMALEPEGPGQ
jgi:hypothetical protein